VLQISEQRNQQQRQYNNANQWQCLVKYVCCNSVQTTSRRRVLLSRWVESRERCRRVIRHARQHAVNVLLNELIKYQPHTVLRSNGHCRKPTAITTSSDQKISHLHWEQCCHLVHTMAWYYWYAISFYKHFWNHILKHLIQTVEGLTQWNLKVGN